MMLSPFVADISNNDPEFDAKRYRESGHVAIALKASEGTDFIDAYHRRNAVAAGAHGIAVFHYHFARPDAGTDPNVEAAHFIGATQGLRGQTLRGPRDYLVLDIERATPQGWRADPEWCQHFDAYVRKHTRYRTIIYGSRSNLQTAPAHDWFAAPPFREWDADWSVGPDGGSPGAMIVLRQFTDGVNGPTPHTLPGVAPHVDVNIMRGGFRAKVLGKAA